MNDQPDNLLPPRLRPPAELSDEQLEELRKSGEWNQGHFAEYQARQFQNLKESVDRLAKPHRVVRWTLAVASLTFVVCVIGYWDQIARLIRALRFW
jgi:hypothetical protein